MSNPRHPSYRPNLNRNPTKKWAEAQSVDYGGDDWGEDDYDHYDQPGPEPFSAGTQRHPGWDQRAGHAPQRSFTSPSMNIDNGRTFTDRNDERRNFSGGGYDPRYPSQPNATYGSHPQAPDYLIRGHHDAPGLQLNTSMPNPMHTSNRPGSRGSAQNDPYGVPYSAPASNHPRRSSLDNRSDHWEGPATNEFREPRDRSNSSRAAHPQRQSSLSQQSSSADENNSMQPNINVTSRASQSSIETKPLPFVRPADIYKRIPEEREKERRSQESSRSSIDVVTGRVTGSPTRSADASNPTITKPPTDDIERSRRLKSTLDTVAERKSEYGISPIGTGTDVSPVDTTIGKPPTTEPADSQIGDIQRPPVGSRQASSIYTDHPDPTSASSVGNHPFSTMYTSARTPATESPLHLTHQYSPISQRDSGLHGDAQPELVAEDLPNFEHGIPAKLESRSDEQHLPNHRAHDSKISLQGKTDQLQYPPSSGHRSVMLRAFDEENNSMPLPSNTNDTIPKSDDNTTPEFSPIIGRGIDQPSSSIATQKTSALTTSGPTVPHHRSDSVATVTAADQAADNTILPSTTFVPNYHRETVSQTVEANNVQQPLSIGTSSSTESQHRLLSTVPASSTSERDPTTETLPATQYTPVINHQALHGQSTSQAELVPSPTSRTASEDWQEWQAQRQQFKARHGIEDSNTATPALSSPVSRAESPAKGTVRNIAGRLENHSGRSSPVNNAPESRTLTTQKPATTRSESFRPVLPGGWQSYTTNTSTSENREASPKPIQPPAMQHHSRTESTDSIPTATAPKQWHSSHSGPMEAAFAAAAAAGNAMVGAFSGSGLSQQSRQSSEVTSEDDVSEAEQQRPPKFSETRDFASTTSPQATNPVYQPRLSANPRQEPENIENANDAGQPQTGVDLPAPLRMSRIGENRQPSPRRSTPSMVSIDRDHDPERLQHEIVQSLTPKNSNVSDMTTRTIQDPSTAAPLNTGLHRQVSIISDDGGVLPRGSSSYWSQRQAHLQHDDHEKGVASTTSSVSARPPIPGPIVSTSNNSAQSIVASAVRPPIPGTSPMDQRGFGRSTDIPVAGSQVPSSRPLHESGASATAHPNAPSAPVQGLTPIKEGDFLESEGTAADKSHMPETPVIKAGGPSDPVNPYANRPPIPQTIPPPESSTIESATSTVDRSTVPGTASTSNDAGSARRPFLDQRYSWEAGSVEPSKAPEPSSPDFARGISGNGPSTPTSTTIQPPSITSPPTPVVHKVTEESQAQTQSNITPTSSFPPQHAATAAFPKGGPDFKSILAFHDSTQRIRAFDENRRAFAEPNGLLEQWISSMNIPEHSDVFNASHSPHAQPTVAPWESRPSPRREANGQPGTKQIQEDGKRLLAAAGKYGGKAGIVAKGFFSRGKDKLRTASASEKVPKSARRTSSVYEDNKTSVARPQESVLPERPPQIPTPALDTPPGESTWFTISSKIDQMFQERPSQPTAKGLGAVAPSSSVNARQAASKDDNVKSFPPSTADQHRALHSTSNEKMPPASVVASLPGGTATPERFPNFAMNPASNENTHSPAHSNRTGGLAGQDTGIQTQVGTQSDRRAGHQRMDSLPVPRQRRPSSISDVSEVSTGMDETSEVIQRNVSPALENQRRDQRDSVALVQQISKEQEALQSQNRVSLAEGTLPPYSTVGQSVADNKQPRISSGAQIVPVAELRKSDPPNERQGGTRPFSFIGSETLNHNLAQQAGLAAKSADTQQSPVEENNRVDIEKSPQPNITEHPAYRNTSSDMISPDSNNPLPSARRSPQDLGQARSPQQVASSQREPQGEGGYRIPGPYVQEYRSPRSSKPTLNQESPRNVREDSEGHSRGATPAAEALPLEHRPVHPVDASSQIEQRIENDRGQNRGFGGMFRTASRSQSRPNLEDISSGPSQASYNTDDGKRRKGFFSFSNRSTSPSRQTNVGRVEPMPGQDSSRSRKLSIDMLRPSALGTKHQTDVKKKRSSGFGALFGISSGKDKDDPKAERYGSAPSSQDHQQAFNAQHQRNLQAQPRMSTSEQRVGGYDHPQHQMHYPPTTVQQPPTAYNQPNTQVQRILSAAQQRSANYNQPHSPMQHQTPANQQYPVNFDPVRNQKQQFPSSNQQGFAGHGQSHDQIQQPSSAIEQRSVGYEQLNAPVHHPLSAVEQRPTGYDPSYDQKHHPSLTTEQLYPLGGNGGDPHNHHHRLSSTTNGRYETSGSAYQETRGHYGYGPEQMSHGQGANNWRKTAERTSIYGQAPNSVLTTGPMPPGVYQRPVEAQMPMTNNLPPVSMMRGNPDFPYGQDRPYVAPPAAAPVPVSASASHKPVMAEHVKDLHKRSRSPRLGRPPSDEHFHGGHHGIQNDSRSNGRGLSTDPASQLGTFSNKKVSPGGGIQRSEEEQEKPWTIGLPDGGEDESSENDAHLNKRGRYPGTSHPTSAVSASTAVSPATPHQHHQSHISDIVSPVTATEPEGPVFNPAVHGLVTESPKVAAQRSTLSKNGNVTANSKDAAKPPPVEEQLAVPPSISSAAHIPHPNPPSHQATEEVTATSNNNDSNTNKKVNDSSILPQSQPSRVVKQALIERTPSNSQAVDTTSQKPLTVAEKVMGIQPAARGTTPEHRSSSPISKPQSMGTQPNTSMRPERNPSGAGMRTANNGGTTVVSTTMRTGSKAGRNSVRTSAYVLDATTPSRSSSNALQNSSNRNSVNNVLGTPTTGTAPLSVTTANANSNTNVLSGAGSRSSVHGERNVRKGKQFEAVELPGSRPEGYESEEEIMMSATAYPGQEWMPEFAQGVNWDD